MKIAIGCDPNAESLKQSLIATLTEEGYEVEDFGSNDTIYANVAFKVGEAVASGSHDRGILICGTGIGVSIAANKVKGVAAALVSDCYSAQRAALSNNANVITLGSQVTGEKLAQELALTYLRHTYVPGGRSQPKVDRISEYEMGQ